MRAVVVETPSYSQKHGGFPDEAACAAAYRLALTTGAEEIRVQCQGQRTHTYTLDQVRAFLRTHLEYLHLDGLGRAYAPQGVAVNTGPSTHRVIAGIWKTTPGGLVLPT